MRLYLFPSSSRVLGIIALKNHLALDCEFKPIDLGRGDQLVPEYLALNPNKKMPTLTDGEFVLWESNAILFYMASKRPESGLWPSDLRGQADVLRWLAWESAHWDAESCGMVAFEKGSKAVLGLGAPDPALYRQRRAELRPLRGGARRAAEEQDLADRRAAHHRRFLYRGPHADRGELRATARALLRNQSLVRRPVRAARLAGCSRCQGRSRGCLVRESKWVTPNYLEGPAVTDNSPDGVIRLWPEGPPSETADSVQERKTADIATRARSYTMLISCSAKEREKK
jgi:glutathione S-transferase